MLGRLDPQALASLYGDDVERRRLGRRDAGDLDVILGKALQREPGRRYATAAAFADDLRRWRSGRPIAARPDSSGYRLRTFVRRHRWGVAAASALLLVLLAGFGTALWQADRARQQAQRAQMVKEFVLSLFREQDPVARAQAQARTPRELVDEGIERARRELAGDPNLRLDVLSDLGALPAALGAPALSEEVLTQVLEERRRIDGEDALATARVEADLGAVMIGRSDPQQARQLLARAEATMIRLHGEGALETLRVQAHRARLESLASDRVDALRIARQVHAGMLALHGPDHLQTLESLALVASILEQIDLHAEAEQAWTEVIAGIERTLGDDHARLIVPLANIGHLARTRQDYPAAAELLSRGVGIARKRLGEGHPVLGGTLLRLGDALRRMGDFKGAAEAFDEAETCLVSNGAQTAQLWMFRGALMSAQRRHREAADAYSNAQRLFIDNIGEDSPFPWLAAIEYGAALSAMGDLDGAEVQLVKALERQEAINGADSYDAAFAAGRLATLRRLQGRHPESLALSRRQIAILEDIYGADHPNCGDARFELARTLHKAGSLAEARSELDRVISQIRPGTSTATLAPAIHIESARLAQAEGDHARMHRDAAHAGDLLAALPDPDPGLVAAAIELAGK